jgi:hypothetical protein
MRLPCLRINYILTIKAISINIMPAVRNQERSIITVFQIWTKIPKKWFIIFDKAHGKKIGLYIRDICILP